MVSLLLKILNANGMEHKNIDKANDCLHSDKGTMQNAIIAIEIMAGGRFMSRAVKSRKAVVPPHIIRRHIQ